MFSSLNSYGAVTRTQETDNLNSSRFNEACKYSENLNPNVLRAILKLSNSSSIKFGNSAAISEYFGDSSTMDSILVEKKIAKMNSCSKELNTLKETDFCRKSHGSGNGSLRACHEDSFNCDIGAGWEELERQCELSRINGENEDYIEKNRVHSENDWNRCRDRLLEEARDSVPEPGSGRVMHLVKTFEELLSFHKLRDCEEEAQEVENAPQQPQKVWEMQESSSLFPSDFFVTLESLDLHSRRSCSLDSSQDSILTKTSAGRRRSWLSSPKSVEMFSRRHRRRRPRATSTKPFVLQTEERGKIKKKEFMKKSQQLMEEEEKLWMPATQGFPWTTEEPECVVKPPVKENTRPIDLVLHSDTRAVERAGFDHQVAKKISLLDHYRMEREKQQKLTEEDEIRRLRRGLVPKALPMPYFDRPFVPKRSAKHPTIPREPKFQIPLYKKKKSLKSLDGFCLRQ